MRRKPAWHDAQPDSTAWHPSQFTASFGSAALCREADRYFEPFAGGGAVYFSLAPRLSQATLLDRNMELVLAYQAIKEEPGALLTRLKEDDCWGAGAHALPADPLHSSARDLAATAARVPFQ
jgi:hypothetical protein